MPLSCDCYGGCWGDHSAKWPKVVVPKEIEVIVHQACWSVLNIPYGCYVLDEGEVRTETEEQARLVNAYVASLTKPKVRRRIYLASSWKNRLQPNLLAHLRAVGHEVYDFRNPLPGDCGFSWKQVGLERDEEGKVTLRNLVAAHSHGAAAKGFRLDFAGMCRSDACVLLLPSGNSAHLEAGWMAGRGKPVFVYADRSAKIEPELMYMIPEIEGMHDTVASLLLALAETQDERILRTARANGCSPIWSEHYEAWCCGCPDGFHVADQQCSMISTTSARKSRAPTK